MTVDEFVSIFFFVLPALLFAVIYVLDRYVFKSRQERDDWNRFRSGRR